MLFSKAFTCQFHCFYQTEATSSTGCIEKSIQSGNLSIHISGRRSLAFISIMIIVSISRLSEHGLFSLTTLTLACAQKWIRVRERQVWHVLC